MKPQPAEKTIFLDALEIEDDQARAQFVLDACGHDQTLRQNVQELLAAHELPSNPLDVAEAGDQHSKPGTNGRNLIHPSDHLGEDVDGYRLLELLGDGGFGLVFVAQQSQPVKRRVALKLLRPGMGTKEVLARFDAERQVLAMMEHPNIARVFDAGETEDGRPYFVMELVKGLPITEFCDKQQLTLPERLRLFQDVCGAVHHAHQKGIIHRDIKPSNVLVSMHADKPTVKVIDFGISKAVGQSLTEQTIYTRSFSMMGTPLYMSPEQAEMNGYDIDVRSDVYSLGVLLYELLVGTTPFDSTVIDSASYDEVRRIIREQEPQLPSHRCETLGDDRKTTTTQDRKLSNKRLSSALRGDIDWIVMKALEKDRTRRFDSASALSADIGRFLDGSPIEARPPSTTYRLSRLASRHRVALTSALLILFALIAGTGASLWQMSKAITERDEKDAAVRETQAAIREAEAAKDRLENFVKNLKEVDRLISKGRALEDQQQWAEANVALSEAVELLPEYYAPRLARARFYAELNLWEKAADDFEVAVQQDATSNDPQWHGVSQLLLYTNHQQAYLTSVQTQLDLSEDGQLSWDALAAAVLTSTNKELAYKLAQQGQAMIDAEPRRPPGPMELFGPMFGEGPRGGPDGRPPRREDGRRPSPNTDPRRENRRGGRRGPPPVAAGRRFFIVGLANFRAGEFEAAFANLEAAEKDWMWESGPLVDLTQALIWHAKNDQEKAVAALEQGSEKLDAWTAEMSEDNNRPVRWVEFIEAQILFELASQEILARTPEPSRYMQQIEQNALEKLTQGLGNE